MKQTLWILLVLALLWPLNTSAHAVLVESSIASGAVLEVAPADVTLRFSEPIDPDAAAIELYNENSVPFALDHPDFPARDQMHVALPEILRPGSYTLVYRVLSNADGHRTAGSVLFSVGTGAAPIAVEVPQPLASGPATGSIIARMVQVLAGAAVFGGMIWLLVLVWPLLAQSPTLGNRLARQSVWGVQWALLGVMAGTLWEFLQRMAELGGGHLRFETPDTFWIVASSQWGALALTRIVASVILVQMVFLTRWRRGAGLAATGISALMLLSWSASGHAAAEAQPLFPIFTDWLHFLTAGVWIAGVIGLLTTVWVARASDERTFVVTTLVSRFSPLAQISVALLIVTGSFQAFERLTTWSDLWTTRYGLILLLKLALMLVALALGAWHWQRSRKQLAAVQHDPQAPALRRFARSVCVESLSLLGVMLVAGLLVQTPHPVTASARPSTPGSGSTAALPTPTPVVAEPLTLTATSAGLTITLQLDDRRAGERLFSATVSDSTGPVQAERVRLRFESLDITSGQQIAILEQQPDGSYQGRSSAISLIGRWKIELQVRRLNVPDVTVDWTVEIIR